MLKRIKSRITARAIVLHEDGILLMQRTRSDRGKPEQYFSTLGWWVDSNETIEEGLHRELREEAQIQVEIIEKIGELIEYQKYQWIMKEKIHHIYLVKNIADTHGQPIGPEAKKQSEQNSYHVTKILRHELPFIKLNSTYIHKHLVEYAYKKNFISTNIPGPNNL